MKESWDKKTQAGGLQDEGPNPSGDFLQHQEPFARCVSDSMVGGSPALIALTAGISIAHFIDTRGRLPCVQFSSLRPLRPRSCWRAVAKGLKVLKGLRGVRARKVFRALKARRDLQGLRAPQGRRDRRAIWGRLVRKVLQVLKVTTASPAAQAPRGLQVLKVRRVTRAQPATPGRPVPRALRVPSVLKATKATRVKPATPGRQAPRDRPVTSLSGASIVGRAAAPAAATAMRWQSPRFVAPIRIQPQSETARWSAGAALTSALR